MKTKGKKLIANTKGFTLIELAIVLVIIGIIIGAVLKGQDLIENARHKKFANTVKHFEVLTWGFLDRQGYFPGDDNKDGLIEGDVQTALKTKGRFLDPPSSNSITLGSYTFYVFLGNDGTKNILTICKSDNCGTAFAEPELAYVEAFDTSIDGTADGTAGRVIATTTPPTTANSSTWLATFSNPTSSAYGTNTLAVLYYFDRK